MSIRMMTAMESIYPADQSSLVRALGNRSVVFVGLMGAGKSVIGRKVAFALGLPFIDSDHEIESVSRMSIAELFETFGEPEFRSLERRVIARLLTAGPQVISTGGGAFVDPATRRAVAANGVSVWLKAELDILMERVMKRQNRPLLKTHDPRAVMQRLMEVRHPFYAEADVTVMTRNARKEVVAAEVLDALRDHLAPHTNTRSPEE